MNAKIGRQVHPTKMAQGFLSLRAIGIAGGGGEDDTPARGVESILFQSRLSRQLWSHGLPYWECGNSYSRLNPSFRFLTPPVIFFRNGCMTPAGKLRVIGFCGNRRRTRTWRNRRNAHDRDASEKREDERDHQTRENSFHAIFYGNARERELIALEHLARDPYCQAMNFSLADAGDAIHIAELELAARIGVTDEERAEPQRLTVSMTLWPMQNFRELEDNLERTIDYAAVCRAIENLASQRADQLIETLANEIAAHLLANFPIRKIEVELRKFILPQVNFVAVRVLREK